jgi:hypothetical protein
MTNTPDTDTTRVDRQHVGTPATPTQPTLAEHYVGSRYLQLVVVLGALSAIGPMTVDTYLPALPIIRAEFGATDVQAQATLTGLLLGLGLGQLVVGAPSRTPSAGDGRCCSGSSGPSTTTPRYHWPSSSSPPGSLSCS